MSLVLNEEQIFLKDSAKKFASEKLPQHIFVKSEIVKLKLAMMRKFGKKWYLLVGLEF